jgi:hypothetical protein
MKTLIILAFLGLVGCGSDDLRGTTVCAPDGPTFVTDPTTGWQCESTRTPQHLIQGPDAGYNYSCACSGPGTAPGPAVTDPLCAQSQACSN